MSDASEELKAFASCPIVPTRKEPTPIPPKLKIIWDRVDAKLARAKPFLDEYTPPKFYRAKGLIHLGFCILATEHGPEYTMEARVFFTESAESWVDDMLNAARNRYRDGCYANPYGEPMVRS